MLSSPIPSSPEYEIRPVLLKRASIYTSSLLQRELIVEKTILSAGHNPELIIKSPTQETLFRLLHGIAQRELGLAINTLTLRGRRDKGDVSREQSATQTRSFRKVCDRHICA